jgi:hypothetical protein
MSAGASGQRSAFQIPGHGAIQNRFNILSKDHKKYRPEALASVAGLRPSELARELKVSRPTTYQEEVLIKPEQKKVIINIVIATDLAFELLGNNLKEARNWFLAPNSLFFGDSPFEICLRGDGKSIVEWLNQRLGRHPGFGF